MDSRRDIRPPMAKFSPSIWGDQFSTFSFDHQLQERYAESIEALKKEVRRMVMDAKSSNLIKLLDTIERLGLAFHFEIEIEQKLHEIYLNSHEEFDLFTTALRFRLLRQHRHQVSCNVFEKFMNKENKFDESLVSDVEGLLSLYEAADTRINGESILDEAVVFTTHHLTLLEPQLEPPFKDCVKRALHRSLHRGIVIFNLRPYISVYETNPSRNEVLLQLAKLNFNFLQNIYKTELCEISRWWNKFDLKSKLEYARDRIVECYIWGVAAHFEPQYSHVRAWFAKTVNLATIIDDTYDNYATLAEEELFNQHLERGNMDDIDQLPDHMQIVYRYIMSIYEDYERDVAAEEKSFAVPYFRQAVEQLAQAYYKEQIWIMEEKMPSFEEYMKNSVLTSCIYLMFTAAIPGMKSATKEYFDWLFSHPKIVISTAMMGRHLQDLGSHERENRGGKLLTVVDCYMKDKHVSKEEAIAKFKEFVEDEWKNINTEWVMQTSSDPKEVFELLLNYARLAEVIFKNSEDGYTTPENNLAPNIRALFMDPILI